MLSRTRKFRPKVIDLNLVPLELRQPFFTRRTLYLAGAVLVGVVLFLLTDNFRARTELQIFELEGQVATARSLIQKENGRISEEQAEVAKVEQEINRLKDDIARFAAKPQLRTRRLIPLAPAVEAALSNQPAGVQLITLAWQEPKLLLQGKASSTSLIIAYAERLKSSGRFSDVALKVVATIVGKPEGTAIPPTEFGFTLETEVEMVKGTG